MTRDEPGSRSMMTMVTDQAFTATPNKYENLTERVTSGKTVRAAQTLRLQAGGSSFVDATWADDPVNELRRTGGSSGASHATDRSDAPERQANLHAEVVETATSAGLVLLSFAARTYTVPAHSDALCLAAAQGEM